MPAGAFTNQIQKGFEEPRLLIVTDPRTDHQSIKEAAYMNIPVIAFCDTDSDLQVCVWLGVGVGVVVAVGALLQRGRAARERGKMGGQAGFLSKAVCTTHCLRRAPPGDRRAAPNLSAAALGNAHSTAAAASCGGVRQQAVAFWLVDDRFCQQAGKRVNAALQGRLPAAGAAGVPALADGGQQPWISVSHRPLCAPAAISTWGAAEGLRHHHCGC